MFRDKYEPPNPARRHTLMSQDDAANGKKTAWNELEITGSVKSLSPALWNMTHLRVLYLNDNQLTRLPGEISRLVNLRYLDVSSNKLRALPSEIGDMVELRELLANNNLLRSLPQELGKLFQLVTLGLHGNPLPGELLGTHNDPSGVSKLLQGMLDTLPVQSSHPPERLWVPSCHQERNRPTAIFTVMCYNVLCDKYCTRQLYGYSPSWALNWEYRKKGILEEIRHYSADIISLQEVETEHFTNFFEAELKKEGYEGIFAPKSRARTMTENERKHVDGCAIFWKTSKFGLIKEQLIEFNQLAIANAEGSQDMLNRVMTKDNIGLVALLETKEGIYQNGVPPEGQVRQVVMVATVHVVWDPEFCDVKLIQTLMLTNELKNMMESSALSFRPGASAKVDCNQVPMLLCGDFNSLPNSGVVELLREGKVARTHEDFKDISYENILKAFSHTKDNDYLTHGFRMKQALEESFMQYTNYTYDFKGMIDYIFYTEDHMNLLGALGPLSPEWFKENKVVGCPHPHVPSDHFPLVVEFEMPTPTGRQTRSSTSGASNGLGLRR